MVALITGVTGFVGSHLAELLLAEGEIVVGLARTGRWVAGAEHLKEQVRLATAEIGDGTALAEVLREHRPERVFHLAGQANVPASFRDPAESWRTNFTGTQALLAAVEDVLPEARVLHVSTGTIYGRPRPEELPIVETTPYRPTTPYAHSKLAADLLALDAAHKHGTHVVVARSFNHIGPRQQGDFAIARFAEQIARRERDRDAEPIHVGRLDVARDFTDVRDIVRAYVLLLERGMPGAAYNVASGTTWRLADLLDRLRQRARRSIEVATDPAHCRADDPPILSVDVALLRRETGWQPRVPIDQTLADTLDYWRTIVGEC